MLNMFNILLKVSAGNICNTSGLYRLQGVEATESVQPKSTVIFKMDKAIATSLLPQKLQGHVDDIVWIGSSDGFLYKVLGVFITGNQLSDLESYINYIAFPQTH